MRRATQTPRGRSRRRVPGQWHAPRIIALLASCALGLAAASSVAVGVAAASIDESTSYQVDPAHDGVLSGFDLPATPSQQWSITLPGAVTPPYVVDGTVYEAAGAGGSGNPALYAIDQATGAIEWTRSIDVSAGVAYDRGRLFVEDQAGLITAIDATTGAVDWAVQMPEDGDAQTQPTAANGILYTSGTDGGGSIYASDERNGAILWSMQSSGLAATPQTISGGDVYLAFSGDDAAFDGLTGAADWSTTDNAAVGPGAVAVVADGHAYFRNVSATGQITDAATGQIDGSLAATAPPAVTGGAAYELLEGPDLARIDDDGLGTEAWSFAGDGTLDGPPLVIGDTVFVGSTDGHVYAVDPSTGSELWSAVDGPPVDPAAGQVGSPIAGLSGGNGSLLVAAGQTLTAYGAPPTGLAPTNTLAPSLDGPAQESNPVAVDVGVWTGLPSAYTYTWERCDSAGAACQPITGAGGPAYTPQAGDIGATLEVTVTAANADGDSPPVTTTRSPVVAASVPVIDDLPEISGVFEVGQVLTASTGTWANEPTSYTYQWDRCSYLTCAAIDGATGSSYTLTGDDLGDTLTVVVTATNDAGNSVGTHSLETPFIAAPPSGPPQELVPPSVSGNAVDGQVLEIDYATWTESPVTPLIQWLDCDATGEDCQPIDGATQPTLTLADPDVGHTIRVQETAVTSGGSSPAASSDPTAVVVAAAAQSDPPGGGSSGPSGAGSPPPSSSGGAAPPPAPAPTAQKTTTPATPKPAGSAATTAAADHLTLATRLSPANVRLHGLELAVTCPTGCRAKLSLYARDGAVQTLLGSLTRRLPSGRAARRLRLTLGAPARARLGRLASRTIVVDAVLTDPGGRRTTRRWSSARPA